VGVAAERFEHGDLFICATAQSESPQILDAENKALSDRVHSMYFGLLVCAPFIHHDHALRLTGVNLNGELEGREGTQYDRIPFAAWAPWPQIDATVLSLAAQRGDAFQALQKKPEFDRFWRTTSEFYNGLRAQAFGERVCHFVRAIDGFVLPGKGQGRRDFVGRSALFVGDGFSTELGQIYDIRSAVVHMHHAQRYLPQVPPRQRALLLLKRTFQAEGGVSVACR
jgi:hypothetical protein